MEPFDLIQMRWIALALGGGLILTLLVILGFLGRSLRSEAPPAETPDAELEGFSHPHAVPWFLLALWVLTGVVVVAYVLWSAYGRTNF